MKLFCTIQHVALDGTLKTLLGYFDRPADRVAALQMWAAIVNGRMPKTKPQEWQWVWPPKKPTTKALSRKA